MREKENVYRRRELSTGYREKLKSCIFREEPSLFFMGDNINIFHLCHFQVFTNELVKEINSYISTQRILTEKNTLKEKALNLKIKERIFAHFLFVCLYLEY